MKYYAGIGSRNTPETVLNQMSDIAAHLGSLNYTLRSGGAEGADTAFETGCALYPKQIYLPWKGFNGLTGIVGDTLPTWQRARQITLNTHPAPDRLSAGAVKLHTRNVFQVLGSDLKTPVDFIVCWTVDGRNTGGTGQAMRIANSYIIPIYNLYFPDQYNTVMQFIK